MTDETARHRRWRVKYNLVDYNLPGEQRTCSYYWMIVASSSDSAEATVRALIPDAEDISSSPEEVSPDHEETP